VVVQETDMIHQCRPKRLNHVLQVDLRGLTLWTFIGDKVLCHPT
jgi:hypothetical protein